MPVFQVPASAADPITRLVVPRKTTPFTVDAESDETVAVLACTRDAHVVDPIQLDAIVTVLAVMVDPLMVTTVACVPVMLEKTHAPVRDDIVAVGIVQLDPTRLLTAIGAQRMVEAARVEPLSVEKVILCAEHVETSVERVLSVQHAYWAPSEVETRAVVEITREEGKTAVAPTVEQDSVETVAMRSAIVEKVN